MNDTEAPAFVTGWETDISKAPADAVYPAADIVKFICALLICWIHLPPLDWSWFPLAGEINFLVSRVIGRVGVPFFFTAAGFLLFRKTDAGRFDTAVTVRYVKRIAALIGIWFVLQFRDLNETMWYLSALMVAVVLMGILCRYKVPVGVTFTLAGLCFLVGLLGTSYYGLIEGLTANPAVNAVFQVYEKLYGTSTRTGLFFGFPFVFLGYLFAKTRIVFKKPVALTGLVLSFALLIAEAYLGRAAGLPRDDDLYLSLIPCTLFLFYLCTHVSVRPRRAYVRMRGTAYMLYFSHVFIEKLIRGGLGTLYGTFGLAVVPDTVVNIIAFAVSFALAFSIVLLSERERFSHLRMLYS